MKTRNHSKKREAILAKIRSTTTHPTAEWVHRELKGDYPDLSLGTVYRNIGLFKEDGEIVSVGTVAGQERFDGNVKPHAHFICGNCRAVIDIETPTVKPEAMEHLKQAGYSIDRVDLTVYGICSACR